MVIRDYSPFFHKQDWKCATHWGENTLRFISSTSIPEIDPAELFFSRWFAQHVRAQPHIFQDPRVLFWNLLPPRNILVARMYFLMQWNGEIRIRSQNQGPAPSSSVSFVEAASVGDKRCFPFFSLSHLIWSVSRSPPPPVNNQAQQARSNFLCPVFRGDNVIPGRLRHFARRIIL